MSLHGFDLGLRMRIFTHNDRLSQLSNFLSDLIKWCLLIWKYRSCYCYCCEVMSYLLERRVEVHFYMSCINYQPAFLTSAREKRTA